jgi:3-methylfumaryl-CoA hydratase
MIMTEEPAIHLENWSAASFEASELITSGPVRRLAALLDQQANAFGFGVVPPLGHWLYFLPEDAQSCLGEDGNPERGELLPPVRAPHRMWAGGRVEFHAPLSIDAVARRTSRTVDVRDKSGRSGDLTFVTVRHEIRSGGTLAVVEEQDLVFRDAGVARSAAGAVAAPARTPGVSKLVTADTRSLFRFSALTNNAHRIHYDQDYARNVEGYPDLVVHGPFQAILLMNHLLTSRTDASPATFSFRGVRPIFVNQPFTLNMAEKEDGIALWTSDGDGAECFRAKVTLR